MASAGYAMYGSSMDPMSWYVLFTGKDKEKESNI